MYILSDNEVAAERIQRYIDTTVEIRQAQAELQEYYEGLLKTEKDPVIRMQYMIRIGKIQLAKGRPIEDF